MGKGRLPCVQRLAGEPESVGQLGGPPAVAKVGEESFVLAVELVAHDGMTDVRQVNADLVLPASVRADEEKGERSRIGS